MAKKEEKKRSRQQTRAAKRDQKATRRQHRRKAHAVLSQEQMADQLRALAAQVESGTFVLGDKQLELPPHARFEISYKVLKRGGHQIEVEIEWGKPSAVSLLATE
jgi:amphi-Trp domain-containing protein